MQFFEHAADLVSHEIAKWRSNRGRVRVIILAYAFGQNRIQLSFSDDGSVPDHLTDIILEMWTYSPLVARVAAEKLMSGMEFLHEDAPIEYVKAVRDDVVRSYGGDPKDTRQRLDNLMKYGKNELDPGDKP